MAHTFTKRFRCFLCQRKTFQNNDYYNIYTSICPVSKKNMVLVLEHLARQSNFVLHIPRGGRICVYCHAQIVDFDTSLVKVLRKQRNLSKLIEKAIISTDSDFEDNSTSYIDIVDELKDSQLLEDEFVSDTEIHQTMSEATSNVECGSQSQIDYRQKTYYPHKQHSDLLQCSFCASRFKSKFRLQRHISQTHKKFSCELCDYSHRNEDYVKLHMNLHEGRNENQCRFCDKDFSTKISTIRHMEVHLDSKKYQCDKCGLCFSQTTVLYNHKLQHEAEEQPLRCEICNQTFKTKRTYRHHMVTHRVDRPRYSCDYCAKTFTEKYTLKVHKRSHPEANEITFPQQHNVRATIHNLVPETLNKFLCIICDQSFGSKDQLNKHMEKEHDVILKSLTNINQYEVIVDGSRKSCHICGHMFSTDHNLDYHLEHMHGICVK